MLAATTSNEKGTAPDLAPTFCTLIYVRSNATLREQAVTRFVIHCLGQPNLRSPPTREGISLWLQPQEFCVELQWFEAAWWKPHLSQNSIAVFGCTILA